MGLSLRTAAFVCCGFILAMPRDGRAAQQNGPDIIKILGHTSANALAGAIRGYLIEVLPPVLMDKRYNWGNQKLVARGLKWKGKLWLRPEVQRSHKNDGKWKRIRVEAPGLRDSLVFDVRDVHSPAKGRIRFTAYVSFDTRIHYDQQNWRAGTRTWAGSVRARARVKLTLKCEVISRLENKPGQLLADLVFQMRVYWASFRYDNLVLEHVPGLGGEMAKLIGDAAKRMLTQWKPSVERELIIKANAAIVKAGQTKEVRINLGKLFETLSN